MNAAIKGAAIVCSIHKTTTTCVAVVAEVEATQFLMHFKFWDRSDIWQLPVAEPLPPIIDNIHGEYIIYALMNTVSQAQFNVSLLVQREL